MVGEFEREVRVEDGSSTWEKVYGLKAYSPIAKGFEYSHYDDFGAGRSYGYKRQHLGHDMMGQVGTPIIAVEAGYVDHSALDKQQVTRLVIAQYLAEVREAGVDTLILGCTHYPLIKEMIGWYMGRNVTLVDPAQTAAHHLERTLSEHGLKGNHEKGEAHFYVSDVPDSFAQTADLFLGEYKGGLIDQIAIDKY